MPGTKEGGKKAAAKNLARDPNFYARIGAKGGKMGHTGGFALQHGETLEERHARAAKAGAKGGRISKRSKQTT